ncbi:PREDICTED: exosome complex component CSL4 [Nicrophorus vespilloides]|uniref:Exosome complex component CSL4 n=1 Tax=Nicrophorus vespilloides TaxID=110193 RepID=A0ABM1NEN7_NICVS|nr:PREDICTED: exosome complex component CSL4 [Nicrophorus vespilloides]
MEDVLVCIPGQRLCLCDKKHISGQGTYERQGYLYSQLAGLVKIIEKEDGVQLIEVHSTQDQGLVPQQGDLVTVQITIINQQFAKCAIKCIGDTVLSRPYRGILRKEDLRATEKDKIEVYKSVRPGDIVLARVLPITEAHTYHLTTAENELGVVTAHSEGGHQMVPISWTEMQCTKTLVKQHRKVAKVLPEKPKQIVT